MSGARVAVLISGGGTNLQALLDDPTVAPNICVVISNRGKAYGLERARQASVEALHLPKPKSEGREEYDNRLSEALESRGVDWVVCAGFMRVLSPSFIEAWRGRIINIHPALLPSFKGVDGAAQALAAGVTIAGATVHFVDEGTDTGPIIAQGVVPVLESDDLDALKARILTVEHRLLPMVTRWAVEGRLTLEADGVVAKPAGDESRYTWGGRW